MGGYRNNCCPGDSPGTIGGCALPPTLTLTITGINNAAPTLVCVTPANCDSFNVSQQTTFSSFVTASLARYEASATLLLPPGNCYAPLGGGGNPHTIYCEVEYDSGDLFYVRGGIENSAGTVIIENEWFSNTLNPLSCPDIDTDDILNNGTAGFVAGIVCTTLSSARVASP